MQLPVKARRASRSFVTHHGRLAGAMLVAVPCLVGSCGGGDTSTPLESLAGVSLSARLTEAGTLISCGSSPSHDFTLSRQQVNIDGTITTSTSPISCPTQKILAQDVTLSGWSLQDGNQAVASATTQLPDPVVLNDGDQWVVLGGDYPGMQNAQVQLQALAADGTVIGTFQSPTQIAMTALPAGQTPTSWRWTKTVGVLDFTSDQADTRAYAVTDLHYWGALATKLLRTDFPGPGMPYADWGMAPLVQSGRDFRDIRVVDLDNDGLDDIVANVYGRGCTLIGMQQPGGGYVWSSPTHADGSCISGNGETILTADFDGDGLIDIFLPTYQGFNFLKNLGGGKFVEVAQSIGLNYPAYLPMIEGAAVVDINLDGYPDIVGSNLILMNDGTGHFTLNRDIFTAANYVDEGSSVADVDNDGAFDIVKHNPAGTAEVFWGQGDGQHFVSNGWLAAAPPSTIDSSYGVAVGRFSGGQYDDILMAGGRPEGMPPWVCVQRQPRSFDCHFHVIPVNPGMFSDLLMLTDMDGSGQPQLVARYGTLHNYESNEKIEYKYHVTVLDAQGHANQYGRVVRAKCTIGGSQIGMKFVDGGNGYMSQTAYAVGFSSHWCNSINVDIPLPGGIKTFGPYPAGNIEIRLPG
jgi:hypothetical protein